MSDTTPRWEVLTLELEHKVTGDERRDVHVVPIGDLREHDVNQFFDCDCDPMVEIIPRDDGENSVMVCHNAFDGREIIERIEAGNV